MKNISFLFVCVLFLNSCGTVTPIPSHGGGKRFAVEQTLISAVSRKAISDLPLDSIKNKKIIYDVSIIQDEGGGSINGGRPYASEILNLNNHTQVFAGETIQSKQIGFSSQRTDSFYTKDYTFNGSDAKQFTNLLTSSLIRQNIMIAPKEDEGKADFYVEIIVDVLGIWRSRTDWLLSNTENLKALISLEYVITPYNVDSKEIRKVGRISYEAKYAEKYSLWMGPFSSDITIKKSKLDDLITIFGEGSNEYNNVVRTKPPEFEKSNSITPVQINPQLKK